jgi:predicted DNA-binding protein
MKIDEAVLVKTYVLPEVFDRLEALAFESHRTVAAELRVAIDEHLKNTGAK